MSRDEFLRHFRRATGDTDTDLGNGRRIARIGWLLVETHRYINGVRNDCGYNNVAEIIRQSLEKTGMTAKELRQECEARCGLRAMQPSRSSLATSPHG